MVSMYDQVTIYVIKHIEHLAIIFICIASLGMVRGVQVSLWARAAEVEFFIVCSEY
jgi:hypothetical protein